MSAEHSSNFYFFLPSLVDGDFCGDFFAAGGWLLSFSSVATFFLSGETDSLSY